MTEHNASLQVVGSELDIHYTLGPEDHVAFARFAGWDAPERKGYRCFVYALPLLVGLFYLLVQPKAQRMEIPSLIFLGFCVVASLLSSWWVRYRIGWRVRRHLGSSAGKGLTGPIHLTFAPKKISLTGPRGTTHLPKGSFFLSRESPEHFFFYVGEKAAYVLPKAPFSDQQQELIRQTAQAFES